MKRNSSAQRPSHLQSRNVHLEIRFLPPLFLLFSSPWPFSILYYSSKQGRHFSFPRCQHPLGLLSETSAIISLSYRRNGGAFIQSVTFRETSDIHESTAVQVHQTFQLSTSQDAGRRQQNQLRGWSSYGAETADIWRTGRAFNSQKLPNTGSVTVNRICVEIWNWSHYFCYYYWMRTGDKQQLLKVALMFKMVSMFTSTVKSSYG